MKPIETGCTREGNALIPSDGMFLKNMARMDETLNQISPCCFENPLAPMVAADMEEHAVNLDKIRKAFEGLTKSV